MNKKFSLLISVLMLSVITHVTIAIAAGEKSAREICLRKCAEEMNSCMKTPGMTRIKCVKQYDECEVSCKALLK